MPSFSAIFSPSTGLLRPEKTMRRFCEVVTQQEVSATASPSLMGFRPKRDCTRRATPGPKGSAGVLLRLLPEPPRRAALGVAVDVLLLAARRGGSESSRRRTPAEPFGPGVARLVQSRFGRKPIKEGDAVADTSCCVTTSQKRLMVFSGRSNPVLGEKIAEHGVAASREDHEALLRGGHTAGSISHRVPFLDGLPAETRLYQTGDARPEGLSGRPPPTAL